MWKKFHQIWWTFSHLIFHQIWWFTKIFTKFSEKFLTFFHQLSTGTCLLLPVEYIWIHLTKIDNSCENWLYLSCRFSRFTHFCRDFCFVEMYALFPPIFVGKNNHHHYFFRFKDVCQNDVWMKRQKDISLFGVIVFFFFFKPNSISLLFVWGSSLKMSVLFSILIFVIFYYIQTFLGLKILQPKVRLLMLKSASLQISVQN